MIKSCAVCGGDFEARGNARTCSTKCSLENLRETVREQHRRYYAENREKKREYDRRYRAENAEKVREQHRRYYAENREKKREYDQRYCAENREKLRERNRRYNEELIAALRTVKALAESGEEAPNKRRQHNQTETRAQRYKAKRRAAFRLIKQLQNMEAGVLL